MSDRIRLSAIVVAYGKPDLLDACLVTVERALDEVEGATELIVVVNDRSTAVREALEPRAASISLVEGSPDLGFAGGVAAALAVARGTWIALVNDDCTLQVDALEELLAAGESHPHVGSVAAQIRFADRPGTVNSAGIGVDVLGVARELGLGEDVTSVGTEIVEVFGASAALALYRRAMLDDTGGLDTSFFAYLEDADLAWRARMAGWSCLLAPRAVAFHHHSATLGHGSKAKHLLVGRNRVRMLAKNASGRQLRRRLPGMVAYDVLYVAHVAATARSLAPLVGRLQGLREWSAYREAGRRSRGELGLPAAPGLRAALHRSRIYRATPSRAEPG